MKESVSPCCELVYVPVAQAPLVCSLPWEVQLTVADALERSGWLLLYPELQTLATGIFSRLVGPDTVIKPGDRLEFYRPLICDPKETRRRRAKRS